MVSSAYPVLNVYSGNKNVNDSSIKIKFDNLYPALKSFRDINIVLHPNFYTIRRCSLS